MITIIDSILLRRQVLAFYAAAASWELKIVACEWSLKKQRPLQQTFFGCLLWGCAQDQDVKLCCVCKTRNCDLLSLSPTPSPLSCQECGPQPLRQSQWQYHGYTYGKATGGRGTVEGHAGRQQELGLGMTDWMIFINALLTPTPL